MPPKRIGGGGPVSAGAVEVAGEITCKLCIVGSAAAGKTSLATRFTKDEFTLTTEPTIGAAFASQRVTVSGDGGAQQTVKLDIWDTAGQERFRSLTPMYFRGAVGGLVVYDVSSGDTFRAVRMWISDLRKAREQIAIILCGNKCDLPDDKRQVTRAMGEELAEEEGLIFFETSAKTGENVKTVFEELAADIVRKKLVQPPKAVAGVVAPGSKMGNTGANNGGGGGDKKCPC